MHGTIKLWQTTPNFRLHVLPFINHALLYKLCTYTQTIHVYVHVKGQRGGQDGGGNEVKKIFFHNMLEVLTGTFP